MDYRQRCPKCTEKALCEACIKTMTDQLDPLVLDYLQKHHAATVIRLVIFLLGDQWTLAHERIAHLLQQRLIQFEQGGVVRTIARFQHARVYRFIPVLERAEEHQPQEVDSDLFDDEDFDLDGDGYDPDLSPQKNDGLLHDWFDEGADILEFKPPRKPK